MIFEENSLLLFKFGEYKWMKKIQEGIISFSCPGRYIDIAKRTGNNEQGDIDEGVFARLKIGDSRIKKAEELVQDDLEIIPDGKYVKLRRKSTYLIPTFCFYSCRVKDLLSTNIRGVGIQKIQHKFDDNMFSGFSYDQIRNVLSYESYPTTLTIQVEPFKYLLGGELLKQGIDHQIKHINYTEFANDEFYIEPTERREELFYKFPKYSYQREARVCLHKSLSNDIYDRYNLSIGSLSDNAKLLTNKVYLEFTANIVEKENAR
jgi:hypothetical protein